MLSKSSHLKILHWGIQHHAAFWNTASVGGEDSSGPRLFLIGLPYLNGALRSTSSK